ncbi:hypothetical protein HBH49_096510 [Parastagonospora nodorum]|nr:hypothetical protein HBH49_096510 [Parastagonospora nodorum]KAH6018372.1 hypothetical protein HBI83_121870 [Parastagonospora nodorum]
MDPTSPFSHSRADTEPDDVPLPGTPATGNAPSATTAALASSSTVAATEPNIILTHVRHFVSTLIEIVSPVPVRQGWMYLYNTLHNKIATCPAIYRYGPLALIISIGVAEWQQPGFIPGPQQLTNAIIGFLCATILVLGVRAVNEYIETNKWPWQDEEWIWPWEKWLWQDTVYDLGASTRTIADGLVSPPSARTPHMVEASPMKPISPRTKTPVIETNSMLPPTASKRPIIIPPTPQLPVGMRPPPMPAPAQIHRSGIIGESPAPSKPSYSTGNAFAEKYGRLQAVSDWHAGIDRVHDATEGTRMDVWARKDVKGKGEAVESIEEAGDVRADDFREGSMGLLAVPELTPDL